MRNKFVATLKVDIRGLKTEEFVTYLEDIRDSVFDDSFFSFFSNKNDVMIIVLPVRECSDFKIETITLSNTLLEDLLQNERQQHVVDVQPMTPLPTGFYNVILCDGTKLESIN